MFHTVHYTIASRCLPKEFDGFRMVHLSDLHGGQYGTNNQFLIKNIHEARPHIIVMTGDMADDHGPSVDNLTSLCGRLVRHYPIYFTPGNHEQGMIPRRYRKLLRQLETMGVIVLENRWCTISRQGSFLKLYGLVMPMKYYKHPLKDHYVRGIRFTTADAADALGEADRNCYNILLSHNPLYYPSCRDWGADLTLSGHIHGGIIRIPGLGGLLSPDLTLFPRYDGGHFTEQGKHLIVSRGLGNHFLIRIMNPPELVVVHLASAPSSKKLSDSKKAKTASQSSPEPAETV